MLNAQCCTVLVIASRCQAAWVRSRWQLCCLTDAVYPLRVQSVRFDAGFFLFVVLHQSSVIARLSGNPCVSMRNAYS